MKPISNGITAIVLLLATIPMYVQAAQTIEVDGVTYRAIELSKEEVGLLPGQSVRIGKDCTGPVRISFFTQQVTCTWAAEIANEDGVLVERAVAPETMEIMMGNSFLLLSAMCMALAVVSMAFKTTDFIAGLFASFASVAAVVALMLAIIFTTTYVIPIIIAALAATAVFTAAVEKKRYFFFFASSHLVFTGVMAFVM